MQPQRPLDILWQDRHLVAVHKPPGILVHRSPISRDQVFVLQTLRNQLGQRVYPVHRLDRATSGVLLFGLSPESARRLSLQFERGSVEKVYHALARGWVAEQDRIDHPVADEEGNNIAQAAITDYRRLAQIELPYAVDRYPSSRYSIVAVTPVTGRRQQIRKHFKHISHHLIGDTTHGNGRHNRFFRERFDIHRLMLTAHRLAFEHPFDGGRIDLTAVIEPEWQRISEIFSWPIPGR